MAEITASLTLKDNMTHVLLRQAGAADQLAAKMQALHSTLAAGSASLPPGGAIMGFPDAAVLLPPWSGTFPAEEAEGFSALLEKLTLLGQEWQNMQLPLLETQLALDILDQKALQVISSLLDNSHQLAQEWGSLFAFGSFVAQDTWSTWSSFAQAFGGVFDQPASSAASTFASLSNFVMDTVSRLARAIDALFGSNLSGAVSAWQGRAEAWMAEQSRFQKSAQQNPGKKTADGTSGRQKKIKTFEPIPMPESIPMPENSLSRAGRPAGLFTSRVPSLGKVGKVDEVGKIRDEVDISKEDLELLRDIAEMRFVQNFVTLTPQVSMRVDNINENADADRLLEEMQRRLEEEFAAAAEGVYA